MADSSEAIRLDPKYVNAFINRALTYRDKDDLDRAMADFDESIRVGPKNALAFSIRGWANLYGGSLVKALADLDQASALNPKDAYTALWLDIVTKRSNLPSRLPQAVSQIDTTKWPAPLIRLLLGQMTPAAALAAADDADLNKKKRQVCDANFFSGELALQQGAKEEAARLFRLAAADCPHSALPWDSANAELKALGETP
jgi:lipoprotein NlpI